MAKKNTKANVTKKKEAAPAIGSKDRLFSRIPHFNTDNNVGIIDPRYVGLETTTPWHIHDSAEKLGDIHKSLSKVLREGNDHISRDAKNYIKATECEVERHSANVKINAIRNEINYLIFNATIQLIDDIRAAIGDIERSLDKEDEDTFYCFRSVSEKLNAMKESYASNSSFIVNGRPVFSAANTYEIMIAIDNVISMRDLHNTGNSIIKNISSNEFETSILQIANSVENFSYVRSAILNTIGLMYYTIGAAVSASFPHTDELIVSGIPNEVFIMSCIEKKGVFCIYQDKLVSAFNYLHDLIDTYNNMGINIDTSVHEDIIAQKYY